jgi:hypothetical protein
VSLYAITVDGCDDSTIAVVALTEQEADLLRRISERVTANSHYGCQPRMALHLATDEDIENDREAQDGAA